jgi:hypothetical protein
MLKAEHARPEHARFACLTQRRHPHRSTLRLLPTLDSACLCCLKKVFEKAGETVPATWPRPHGPCTCSPLAASTADAQSLTHPVTAPSGLAPAVRAALGAACFLRAKQRQTVGSVKTASSPTRAVLKLAPWIRMRLWSLCVPRQIPRAPGINIECDYKSAPLPA